jgi:hypothetical protein
MSICSGDLILLADQDDVWFSNKVEVIEREFLSNPDKLLAIHDGLIVDEKLYWHGATNFGQAIAGYGGNEGMVTGALTAVRRSFLLFALPIPLGIVGHDSWLHNLARLLDCRFVIDEKLQFIRRYSSNTSNWVASSINEINRLTVFLNQSLTKAANNYNDRIIINEMSMERLKIILNLKKSIPLYIIEKSIVNLNNERNAIINRNMLIECKYFKRKYMAFRMLLNNQYRYFNGFRSFFRDLLR